MLDAVLDAVMLRMAVRLAGQRASVLRLLCGALVGAFAAALSRKMALPRAMTTALWLPVSAAMMAAALGRQALRRPFRHAGLLLCAAGLLGGTVTALYGAAGSLSIAYALSGAGMAAMTVCLLRAGRRGAQRMEIECRYRGRSVCFEAMADSGNTLCDGLTGYPVIVMAQETGRRLFALDNEPLREILADTAGGRQTMRLLVPERTWVRAQGERFRVCAAVALSAALDGGAPVLAPATLMDRHSSKGLKGD